MLGKQKSRPRAFMIRKSAYESNREWSDQFIPEIKKIVGPHLLDVASFELDTTEAMDLIVFKAKELRVAARVRKPGYTGDFLWQFTLRSKAASGAKTELAKVMEGWGDLMFYGHAAKGGARFDRWFLIDLSAWRAQMIEEAFRAKKLIIHGEQGNDDSTAFKWFDLRSFGPTPSIVRAGSHPIPPLERASYVDDEKKSEFNAGFFTYEGVFVGSRYNKFHEIKHIVRAIDIVKNYEWWPCIQRIWCDSQACACFSIYCSGADEKIDDIAEAFNTAFVQVIGGNNGVYVTGNERTAHVMAGFL